MRRVHLGSRHLRAVRRRGRSAGLWLILALLAAPAAMAVEEFERALLAARVDDLVGASMRSQRVPGAAVALVEDGAPLLIRGYGLADLASHERVDAETTVFHAAALAMPVTAVAVLDLAASGRLDLEAGLDRYLRSVRIETPFGRPVTAAQLLTHPAGLDQRIAGTRARSAADLLPLADYLARRLPPVVRPPGTVSVYSEHGYALLGLLVEEVTGRPFASRVEETVLRPLGMTRSGFRAAPGETSGLATGYGPAGVDGPAVPFDWSQTASGSTFFATAPDAARFMIAMLEGSAGRGPLAAAASRGLLERRFGHHPRLPGRTYGLSEGHRLEPRELLQAGRGPGFTSAVVLVPVRRAGLFVAFNSRAYVWELVDRILDRYGELTAAPEPPAAILADDSARYAGFYRSAAIARSSAEKLAGLLGQERARPTAEGRLEWRQGEYVPVAPGLFTHLDGRSRIAFVDGYLCHDAGVLERVGWYETRPVQLALWALFAVLFAVIAAGRGGGRLPAPRADMLPPDRFRPRWPFRLAALAALVDLLFVAALAAGLARAVDGAGGLEYGVPPAVHVLLALPPAAALLAAAAGAGGLAGWWRGYWSREARLRLTASVATLLAFLPFLAGWNLLGFEL